MATGSAPSSEELGASPPGTTPGDADASTTANGGADTGASPSDGGAGDAHTSDAANTHDADAPDAAGHAPDGSADGGPISTGTGHAVFRLAGRWRRIEARAGGAMQDLTSALDSLSSGAEEHGGGHVQLRR